MFTSEVKVSTRGDARREARGASAVPCWVYAGRCASGGALKGGQGVQPSAKVVSKSSYKNIFWPHQAKVKVVDESIEARQLSDLDGKVLRELLEDPAFLQSLAKQNVTFKDDFWTRPLTPSSPPNAEPYQSRNDTSAAADPSGEDPQDASRTYSAQDSGPAEQFWQEKEQPSSSGEQQLQEEDGFKSSTFKTVTGLKLAWGSLMAKVSATLESAGIRVTNQVQKDSAVVVAAAMFVAQRALKDSYRTLAGLAGPMLLLGGSGNVTETQSSLNVTMSLLSQGILPLGFGGSKPRLLGSLEGNSDEEQRFKNAYQRTRRKRAPPLPLRVLGALPSTLLKADDLAYEVEQEIRYEPAGDRTDRALKPLGLTLPGVRARNPYLLRGATGPKPQELGGTQAAQAPGTVTKKRGRSKQDAPPAVPTPFVVGAWWKLQKAKQPKQLPPPKEPEIDNPFAWAGDSSIPVVETVQLGQVEVDVDLGGAFAEGKEVSALCLRALEGGRGYLDGELGRAQEVSLAAARAVALAWEAVVALQEAAGTSQLAAYLGAECEALAAGLEVTAGALDKYQQGCSDREASLKGLQEQLQDLLAEAGSPEFPGTWSAGKAVEAAGCLRDIWGDHLARAGAFTATALLVVAAMTQSARVLRHAQQAAGAVPMREMVFEAQGRGGGVLPEANGAEALATALESLRAALAEWTVIASAGSPFPDVCLEALVPVMPQREERPEVTRGYTEQAAVIAAAAEVMSEAAVTYDVVSAVEADTPSDADFTTISSSAPAREARPIYNPFADDIQEVTAVVVVDSPSGSRGSGSYQERSTGPAVAELVGDMEGVIDLDGVEEVEDEGAKRGRAALKALDLTVLLLEKVFNVVIPAVVNRSTLAWRRLTGTLNPRGSPGWKLLHNLRQWPLGDGEDE